MDSVYNILRGTFLISEKAVKNWKGIFYMTLLSVVMIASSHSADKKAVEIAQLGEEIKEMRAIYMQDRKRLLEMRMESYLTENLKDIGLLPSLVPPLKIVVELGKN